MQIYTGGAGKGGGFWSVLQLLQQELAKYLYV